MNVGFVGIGSQGGPMAHMIYRSGIPTTVYARRPEALEPFVAEGLRATMSLRELGATSDYVGVCVTDDAAVEDVLLGQSLLDDMRAGTVIAVHSTIHPDACRRLAVEIESRGFVLLDAPVSGTGTAAWTRSLVVMVGGDRTVLERCRAVLEAFGNPRYLGGVGSGQLAKLVNNFTASCNLLLARDAIELGVQLGVDRAAITDIMRNGSAGSWALEFYVERGSALLASAAADATEGRPNIFAKDLALVSGIVESEGADPGALGGVAELLRQAIGA